MPGRSGVLSSSKTSICGVTAEAGEKHTENCDAHKTVNNERITLYFSLENNECPLRSCGDILTLVLLVTRDCQKSSFVQCKLCSQIHSVCEVYTVNVLFSLIVLLYSCGSVRMTRTTCIHFRGICYLFHHGFVRLWDCNGFPGFAWDKDDYFILSLTGSRC